MSAVLQELLDLLRLEAIGVNRFRGVVVRTLVSVICFGGQVSGSESVCGFPDHAIMASGQLIHFTRTF